MTATLTLNGQQQQKKTKARGGKFVWSKTFKKIDCRRPLRLVEAPVLKLPQKIGKKLFFEKNSPKWLKISDDAQCVTSATYNVGSPL